jgi:hypothetical protein
VEELVLVLRQFHSTEVHKRIFRSQNSRRHILHLDAVGDKAFKHSGSWRLAAS